MPKMTLKEAQEVLDNWKCVFGLMPFKDCSDCLDYSVHQSKFDSGIDNPTEK